MSMEDLEHGALLGDQRAQEECTRQGIALPCPLCGKQVKRSVSGMLFYCPECHYNTTFHSNVVSKEEALSIWNRRSAPTIGRCKDCAHSSPRMVMGNKTYGKICKIDPYLVHEVSPNGYCDGFKPKEAANG